MSEPQLFLHCERYTEGAVVAPDGRLYFSMTSISTITVVSTRDDGREPRVWAHVPGANGHAIAPDGTHIVMSSTGAFLRLDQSGRIARVIATQAEGATLVYPNDVALDPQRGGFFATDSGYKTMPRHIDGKPKGRIVRVERDDCVRVVADGIAYANGVGLSPDGRTLYVTASSTSTIWSYPVDDEGTLGARTHFADVPTIPGEVSAPDGITMGEEGSLYVAHYGARAMLVYASDGTLVRRIPSGNRCTSHVGLDPVRSRGYISGGLEDESGPGAIFAIDLGTLC